MTTRKNDEQRALDIVAGRGDASASAVSLKAKKASLGGLELAGILLWLLVFAGGGLIAIYHFVLAPK